MKHITLITGLSILILTSCHKEPIPNPYADFGVDYVYVIPGEIVFFTNYSDDANYYEWDFGDGSGSNAFQPSHAYANEGVYTVTLAAYNGNKVDYTHLEIEVYETTLEVEVVVYNTDWYVPDVEVAIFDNYVDWNDYLITESNFVARGYTNQDGIITFVGMEDIEYYIDAWHSNFDNYQLASEDIGFVLTERLAHARHNIFTALVDYYPDGKIKLKSSRMSVKSAEDDKPKRSVNGKKLTRIKEK